jgi:hypothetical protein
MSNIIDTKMVDSTGAYLLSQLTKFDPTLRNPLQRYTWSRDIATRDDLTLGMEFAAFTQDSFTATNTLSTKAFISKNTSHVGAVATDGRLVTQPLYLWSQKATWQVAELASAQILGRPIDAQKIEAVQYKWQQDVNESVYLGDDALGMTGLLNNADVSTANAPNGSWAFSTDPELILEDVNEVLTRAWKNSATAIAPTDLRLSPDAFALLNSMKVSTAGNMSVLRYISENAISNAENGKPLVINSVKYLAGAKMASGKDRMLVYTNDVQYVRMPLVFPQRQQMVYADVAQSVAYLGMIGQVEFLYPETVAYSDLTLA